MRHELRNNLGLVQQAHSQVSFLYPKAGVNFEP